jgi:acyl-CoA synthetase (NDP forming)
MQPLDRLLRPRSIAVIGGGVWCENVIRECRAFGFDGPIWPVHATRDTVAGLAAFPSVDALPGAPDASFVGVNRRTTIDIIRALSARGAGGAVCFAAGFREAEAETGDGAALEAALLDAAGDMRLLGPNCYGFINALDRVTLWPDQHGAVPVDRGVALISQSSNILLNLTMQQRGLPIAYAVTVGNQAQTGLADLATALLADDRVTALGLHIEGIGDLRAFEAMAATARAMGKPVLAVKVGASDQARAATLSHSASLAGSGAGARALFARLGIAQMHSLTALVETLKLLHLTGPLRSNRIASLSCSGGEASLMADSALDHDIAFPPLSTAQKDALRAALGPAVALANPLDYNTYIWGNRPALAACYSAMMAGDLALGCVLLDLPRGDRCDTSAWLIVLDAMADAIAQTGKPMAVLTSLPEGMPEPVALQAMDRGIVPLCGIGDALAAIAAAAWLGQPRADSAPLLLPGPDRDATLLTEHAAKTALAGYGVPVPRHVRATTPADAAHAAHALGGTFVLKGEGPAHKSEAGAVVLGLTTPDAVLRAAQAMGATSFLIEDQIGGAIAELLVGVVRDAAHGFVLTLGAGGVRAELLADTVCLLLPVTATDIDAALDRLRLAPVLTGYRGAPGIDRDALVAAVLAVQDYTIAHADTVAEVEVNPLICTATAAIAVDALIRTGAAQP